MQIAGIFHMALRSVQTESLVSSKHYLTQTVLLDVFMKLKDFKGAAVAPGRMRCCTPATLPEVFARQKTRLPGAMR